MAHVDTHGLLAFADVIGTLYGPPQIQRAKESMLSKCALRSESSICRIFWVDLRLVFVLKSIDIEVSAVSYI